MWRWLTCSSLRVAGPCLLLMLWHSKLIFRQSPFQAARSFFTMSVPRAKHLIESP
jgi:hypothetical protein